MKIGILGGSFDPPHFGHILIAQQVIESAGMDEVWLMPNYSTSAHHIIFQKHLTPTEDRYALVKLIETEKIKASDFEIKHNKKSLTITTLESLSKVYPEDTFYWITGSDKLATFQLYDDWQKIITKYHLIIFPRGETQKVLENLVKEALYLQTIPQNVIVLQNKDLILTTISSTIVRERVKKGLPVDFLIPAKIEAYIIKNKLYG